MSECICLFEGIYYSNLLPLVYFRPVYELRCGILTLREKVELCYPKTPIVLHSRNYLSEFVKQNNPESIVNFINSKNALFINGRILAPSNLAEIIPLEGPDKLYVNGQTIVAARVSGSKLDELKQGLTDIFTESDFTGLVKEEIDINVINYPWDMINQNGKQLVDDFKLLTKDYKGSLIRGEVYSGAYLLNKEMIFIDEGSKILPGAILDADSGPIYIGKNVKVFPNSMIEGPCYIGEKSVVKAGAKIYENTSIGPVCKVGGEIESSIIHSYSNKQHDGFLGHSYLAQWVNLGADTNTSDLKNNYGSVKVIINGEQIDSGTMFVGLTMGDHTKSAINTMFNTGTVVGVSSNIYGAGFPSKFIPSFTWGGSESTTTYDLERSMEVAKRVMERRNVKFTDIDEKLFRKIFDLTREERRKRGMPN